MAASAAKVTLTVALTVADAVYQQGRTPAHWLFREQLTKGGDLQRPQRDLDRDQQHDPAASGPVRAGPMVGTKPKISGAEQLTLLSRSARPPCRPPPAAASSRAGRAVARLVGPRAPAPQIPPPPWTHRITNRSMPPARCHSCRTNSAVRRRNVPAGMRRPPFCEADRADYIGV
jgi:hypothetical protein